MGPPLPNPSKRACPTIDKINPKKEERVIEYYPLFLGFIDGVRGENRAF